MGINLVIAVSSRCCGGSRTSPTEIKKKIAELAKQDLIEQTLKTHNENARVPDVCDLIVWIADEIT